MSDEFEPRLGRIGGAKRKRSETYLRRVMAYAYKSGVKTRRKSSFTGSRIGRGYAFGALASTGFVPGGRRRVIVKARLAMLRAGNLAAARAHMRYIQRDGVTREGEPGRLYGPDTDDADGSAFLDRCDGDRHQFRFIVSADDAAEIGDLKPFIRSLMETVESDLGTRLDWVAVDHFNTGHPHTHVVVRGKTQDRKDLIIARDYISYGIRQRAGELLTLELGPEIESEVRLKLAREMEADRFTRLDRSIVGHMDRGFLVVSALPPSDPVTHAAHMTRLRKLERLGLATERQTGVWEIDPQVERKLRSLGERGDIIKTMHRAMREAGIDRPAGDFVIHSELRQHGAVTGRVAALGLSDELSDQHYVVIDGIDGKVHYADVGRVRADLLPEKGMIVSLEAVDHNDGKRQRTRLRILSYLSLQDLIDADGATWLDKNLVGKAPIPTVDCGFGSEVKAALRNRMLWLAAQGLVQAGDDGAARISPTAIAALQRRDLQRAAAGIAAKSEITHAAAIEGDELSGTFKRSLNLASGKYAVIGNAKEFALVPWNPNLEDIRGKVVAGVAGPNHSWHTLRVKARGLSV